MVSAVKGPPLQVAMIGNEGVVGASVISGMTSMPTRAVVQISGEAKQIETEVFMDLLSRHPSLRESMTRYMVALLNHVAQEAACNQLHTLPQRCARWLLLASDGAGTGELRITHATLSGLLGVRRPSVTIAAGVLQKSGAIRYSRGRVVIVDRLGLEASACECYRIIGRSYKETENR
jgi:CRP-like cAMP-binding protein